MNNHLNQPSTPIQLNVQPHIWYVYSLSTYSSTIL